MNDITEATIHIGLNNPEIALFVTDSIEDLLGFNPTDFLSGDISLQSCIHNHDQDIADYLFSSDIKEPYDTFNIRLRQSNGLIRCVKGTYNKVESNGGITLELLLQDAKSLRQDLGNVTLMTNFKAIMENTDDYIYFKDRNHVFTGASQTLISLTSPSEHWTDLLGLTDYDVFPEEYADVYYHLEKLVFSGVHVAHEEQETLDNDGNKGWVDNRKYPIEDSSGEIIGLFGIARDITGKKQIEKELQTSKKWFQTIFEQAPLGVAVIDSITGHIYDANPAYSSIAGRPIEELRSLDWMEITHPDDVQEDLDNMAAMNAGKTTGFTMQKRYIQPDGNVRWVNMTITPMQVEDKSKPRHLCMTEDITVRQLTEQSLLTKQTLLTTALKAAKLGHYNTNLVDETWTSDPSLDEIFGIESNSTRDFTFWADLIHSDDKKMVFDYFYQNINRREAYPSLKYRIVRPSDKKVVWVEAWGYNIFDDSGQAVKQIGVIQDISERNKSEERLRLSARVFSDTHEGIIITDDNRFIIDVNPAFSDITGYKLNDVIGHNPSFLNSGKQSPEFYQDMWQHINEYGHWQGEVWNRKKDSGIYAELLTISVLTDKQDKITNYVGVFSDITESKQQQEKLDLMAHYDMLTGLPNRILFTDRFHQAIAHSKRTGSQLAICFLDLDYFKPVNDAYGHSVGDQLLISVAERIKASIRDEDTVSRQGGDEFALLLGEIESLTQCERFLERLLTSLAEPYIIDRVTHNVSASIGVTLYPFDDVDFDTLLRHADQAMYKAKQEGRNRHHLFSVEQDQQDTYKYHRLDEIQQALASNELQLYYQPKVNMATGHIFGAEALIRWLHPDRGLISPLEFLPILEGTSLEVQVGNWVIEQALCQLDQWKAQGIELEVSINIASYHLQYSNFIKDLENAFTKHLELERKNLQLEILESSALSDISSVTKLIKTCQEVLGISVALDDFGTGYSSLTHLRHLPAQTIKIDQSFIRDMLDDPDDYAIIDGVMGLAEAFNREVIAEGVETTEHGLMLLIMGCEEAQGYGIAKPMPADDLYEWLKHYKPNQVWLDWASKTLTNKDNKVKLFKLAAERWLAKLKAVINADELPPIMDPTHCHCGRGIQRVKQEHLLEDKWTNKLESEHDKLHLIANDLLNKYHDGNVGAAQEGLLKLQSIFDEMSKSSYS